MPNMGAMPEGIVTKPHQVEVHAGQGMPGMDSLRQIGITEQTYFRWREN